MSDAWFATVPRCPVHGQLHHDRDTWTCPGWDGEGCDYAVTAADLKWAYLGKAEDIQLEWSVPDEQLRKG